MTNQNQPPVPVSGLAAVLAIVQAVVAVVPRWLVIAAGVVCLSWLGFELYLNARVKLAEVEKIEIDSAIARAEGAGKLQRRDDIGKETTTNREAGEASEEWRPVWQKRVDAALTNGKILALLKERFAEAGVPKDQISRRAQEYCEQKYGAAVCGGNQ
jgi:hypothetical protein